MSAFLGTDLMAPAALANWQEVMEDVLLSFVQRGTGRALRLIPGSARSQDATGGAPSGGRPSERRHTIE
jgi:hypothetical protein